MKQSIKHFIGGLFLLALPLMLTSCEGMFDDIFGEWDRPVKTETSAETPKAKTAATISFAETSKTWGSKEGSFTIVASNTGDGAVTYSSNDPNVATVDPTTGEVTPVAVGNTDIIATVSEGANSTYSTNTTKYALTIGSGYHYLEYILSTGFFETKYHDGTLLTSSTSDCYLGSPGWFIVKGHVTISNNSNIYIYINANLILLDGAKLEITNGQLYCNAGNILNIFAQSEGEGMGELVVSCNNNHAIEGGSDNDLYINGGKITAKATGTNGKAGIYDFHRLEIFGGKLTAQGAENTTGTGGHGISMYTYGTTYPVNILNHAKVEAKGGNSTGGNGGDGIKGSVTIKGDASLTAIGGDSDNNGGYGISNDLNYYGGKFESRRGTKSTSGTNNAYAINTLYNKTSSSVTFEYYGPTPSWDWYDFTVSGGGSNTTNVHTSRVRKQ